MADLTQTITNNINVFGIPRSSQWGTMLWGDLWGRGLDLIVDFGKAFTNSVTSTDVNIKSVAKPFSFGSVSVLVDMGSQRVKDSAGYDYLFVANTTEGEERDFTTFTVASAASTTFSNVTATSVTWSAI